jgi:hypothetical protein
LIKECDALMDGAGDVKEKAEKQQQQQQQTVLTPVRR